jgi:hypothetical protein
LWRPGGAACCVAAGSRGAARHTSVLVGCHLAEVQRYHLVDEAHAEAQQQAAHH